MTRLIIRLLPDSSFVWALTGAAGRQGSGLPDAALAAAADEVTLAVPAEQVLLLAAPRISPRRDEMERGLPFAIEERLAGPVENLHVAVGDACGPDRVAALAVDRARIERWLKILDTAGVAVDRLLPESVLLPTGSLPVLWLDGERFVLRLAQGEAIAGQREELEPLLARMTQPLQQVMRSAGAQVPDRLKAMSLEEFDDPLVMLAQGFAHAQGLNLLSGEFAGRRRRHGRDRSVWRWAAALAATALILYLVQSVLELRALQARQTQTSEAMAALYLDLVPDATRVVDAEAQLAVALERVRGGTGSAGALPILARIAPVLGDARYSLDLIEYRDGGLELLVRGPDVAALDALREALSAQLGVAVELTSAVPGQGGVEARYRVRGAGA